jgi:hypothetical protein
VVLLLLKRAIFSAKHSNGTSFDSSKRLQARSGQTQLRVEEKARCRSNFCNSMQKEGLPWN